MANYTQARKKAAEVLKNFGVKEPPIDPEDIAESIGIDVVYASFDTPVSDSISGFIDFSEGTDNVRIVVNDEISPKRKNFTIAHELGHYLLHQDYAQGEGYQILPRSNIHGTTKPDVEKEADAFAAALLAPKSMIERYRPIASLPEMSKIFVASEEMLRWRIHNIDKYGH